MAIGDFSANVMPFALAAAAGVMAGSYATTLSLKQPMGIADITLCYCSHIILYSDEGCKSKILRSASALCLSANKQKSAAFYKIIRII